MPSSSTPGAGKETIRHRPPAFGDSLGAKAREEQRQSSGRRPKTSSSTNRRLARRSSPGSGVMHDAAVLEDDDFVAYLFHVSQEDGSRGQRSFHAPVSFHGPVSTFGRGAAGVEPVGRLVEDHQFRTVYDRLGRAWPSVSCRANYVPSGAVPGLPESDMKQDFMRPSPGPRARGRPESFAP